MITDSSNLLSRIRHKTTNHNTQSANNIQIPNSNDQTLQLLIECLAVILFVLNFEFRSLIFIWDLYFACPPFFWRGAWNFYDFHKPVTIFPAKACLHGVTLVFIGYD
jgi:hypothetical protein